LYESTNLSKPQTSKALTVLCPYDVLLHLMSTKTRSDHIHNRSICLHQTKWPF